MTNMSDRRTVTEQLERFWNWTTLSPWFPVWLGGILLVLAVVYAALETMQ